MGWLLKFLAVLLVLQVLRTALRWVMRLASGRSRRPTKQTPVQRKRARARQQLDADIVDAEFEDLSGDSRR